MVWNKLTYEKAKAYIESFDGYKLMSTEYINASTKLEIECPQKHIFRMGFSAFKSGQRCSACSGNKKLTYEQVKKYVEDNGYTLLSDTYVNNLTKLKMTCAVGHDVEICFANFKNGHRCCYCSGKRQKTYKEVRDTVENAGYKLLSKSYQSNSIKLEFLCPVGHNFTMAYGDFQQGRRCPVCAIAIRRQKRFLKYEAVKECVESDGYILLSEVYQRKKAKLLMQCPEGHVFHKSYDHFSRGQRCPICQESRGESRVSAYLTSQNILFHKEHSFPDCRNIELLRFDFAVYDSYNQLVFLVEYDGEYHYFPIDGAKSLKKQQYHDSLKNTYCSTNSIPLLRIPYTQFDNIEAILSAELTKYNLLSLAS